MPDLFPPTRLLGSGGPEISTLGLGAWAIGGRDWGPQDDRDSIATIHRALDAGLSWIDTAAVYGHGHSERVVARALRGLAERPLVFTKCGISWRDGDAGPDLRPEAVRRGCEESLRRLGVERLDLLQFHAPDRRTGTAVEESWGAMAGLVAEGKVRWAGVSNFDVGLLERCEPIMHVDSLQPPFNAIDRAAGSELLPWCEANGTGVIVYGPMMAGLLTERFSRERAAALDPSDWRRALTDVFAEPALSRNLALRDALAPVADRHGTSVAAVAVAWTLAWPGVIGAIVGARSPQQVDGWIDAASLELDSEDIDAIATAIRSTGAGSGPVQPGVKAVRHGE